MSDTDLAAAVARLREHVANIAAVMHPHGDPSGPWTVRPDGERLNWYLLGPYSKVRGARTILGEISLDSFPGEDPPRAQRLAEAIVAVVNAASALLDAAVEVGRLRAERDELAVENAALWTVLTEANPKAAALLRESAGAGQGEG